MDGFDLLPCLQNNPQFSSIHVVVLTGMPELRELNRAYLLGARSFLSKPIVRAEFQTVVNTLRIPLSLLTLLWTREVFFPALLL